MTSLVEELQRDALDGNVNVSDLLRKAYAVAVKLKLDKFKVWIDSELNGYQKGPVPDYRKLAGTLRAWNPFNGWMPVFIQGDPSNINKMSVWPERSPVGAIHDLVTRDQKGSFIINLPPSMQNAFGDGSHIRYEVSLHIGRATLVRILDTVRNTILDWSLKLEADGILGEGMSFSREEKQKASANADELQAQVSSITIGTMVNSTIQQGSTKSRQSRKG